MLTLLLCLILLIVIALIAWHFLSLRYHLPCPSCVAWMVELDNPFAKNHRATNIIAHAGVQPGMSVLDAGCGPGRVTVPAAIKVGPTGTVYAVDMQTGMLDKVKAKANHADVTNITFLQEKLGAGNLPKSYFDRVLMNAVIGEIPNQQEALAEIFSALKPGGMLSISEVIFDPHYHRRQTVARLACEVGFEEVGYFGSFASYTVNFLKRV